VPIYEYQCTNCGRTLEVMQKITDEPLQKCPSCKGLLRRLISQTSFQLKGSGWYATDYKDTGKKSKQEKLAEKPSEKKEAQADKKTEKTSTA
jgi:putative FmdB family regulatory protein